MNEQNEMKCAYCGKGLDSSHDHCGRDEKAINEIHLWEDEMMQRCGFYIHYTPCDNGYIDCHTHGLRKTFDHPEVQIVLPIRPEIAKAIMNNIVDRMIRLGCSLGDNHRVVNIIEHAPVITAAMKREDGEEYFRIILPDKEWRFPEDEECGELYKMQTKEDLVW